MSLEDLLDKIKQGDVQEVVNNAESLLSKFTDGVRTRIQLAKVASERHAQREEWSPEHDRNCGLQHLAELAEKRIENLLGGEKHLYTDQQDLDYAEKQFTQVAALAVAALEVIEYRRGAQEGDQDVPAD